MDLSTREKLALLEKMGEYNLSIRQCSSVSWVFFSYKTRRCKFKVYVSDENMNCGLCGNINDIPPCIHMDMATLYLCMDQLDPVH